LISFKKSNKKDQIGLIFLKIGIKLKLKKIGESN